MAFLDVRGLEKSYVTRRGTTHVLGGIDLTVDEGEFVAVVGYSGSGKTTLVSLLAGLLPADAGTIVLDEMRVLEPEGRPSVCLTLELRESKTKVRFGFAESSSDR